MLFCESQISNRVRANRLNVNIKRRSFIQIKLNNMSEFNSNKTNFGFDTRAIHAGQENDQWSNLESVPPIVTSVTYYQWNPAKMEGKLYSRLGNPTRDSLERCLAALEESKHAMVFPSGMAAITAILHLLEPGDHILTCSEKYGGTILCFQNYVKMNRIEMDVVDSTDIKLFESAIKPNTKLIFIESPSNPCLKITDIAAVVKAARSCDGVILAVDNTYLTPLFQRPLDLGADISMYSVTKYMNGGVTAGALMFNDSELLPRLQISQATYGSVLPPFDCYLVNRGLKTLALRMRKHCENGIAVAQYLEAHPKVLHVDHPGLPSHPHYELSKKQSTGHSGMLAFRIAGTQEDAKNFIQNLRVISSAASFGSYSSFATIPVCVSHTTMPRDLREKLGIFDETIRLSIGLENIEDLIKDLEQSFEKTSQ
ncbi:putative cystathionine gamma-lyase 2 [Contarinia nasturtii]|uniref:putative cystathionine gamma-lyase 2 n=1 Tax=Contarinia nasturtii TaxID=265458 RepID=UPI0012D4A2B5|nr:putative cystathionine gamma-lyase 2 [Contarinia nasturtii]